MWKHYVYVHRRADDGSVFYVGKGTKRSRDTEDCFDRAYCTKSRNKWWRNVKEKHGLVVEVVAMFNNDADSRDFEVCLIGEYGRKNLVNLTDSGDGCAGIVVSKTTREKLSDLAKRPRSHAWTSAIKAARKNGGNGGVVKLGDRLQDEWRAAISNAAVGKNNNMFGKKGNAHPTSMPVVNIESGIYFESIAEAAESLGYKMQTFHKWMTGARPNNTLWRLA